MLIDDYGVPCTEIRKLPHGSGNILCCYQSFLKEIDYRIERNGQIDDIETRFDIPCWEDLEVYDSIEDL